PREWAPLTPYVGHRLSIFAVCAEVCQSAVYGPGSYQYARGAVATNTALLSFVHYPPTQLQLGDRYICSRYCVRPGQQTCLAIGYYRQSPFPKPEAQLLYQRSEEHTSELQSRENLVCRLLLEKK